MSDGFLNATYYDCEGHEDRLNHETPAAAVEAFLEGRLTPGCDVEAFIREHGPIEVEAYDRAAIDDSWFASEAHELLEDAVEQWQEEFGDPDGDNKPGPDELQAVAPAMVLVLKALFANSEVWRCDSCGSRTFTEDEVLAMMRTERADWFTEPEPVYLVDGPRVDLVFIVSGEECRVGADRQASLGGSRDFALKQLKHTGRPPEEWELFNEQGTPLSPLATAHSLGLKNGARLYVTLKAGTGG